MPADPQPPTEGVETRYEEPIRSQCCPEYVAVWQRPDTRQYVNAWPSDRELWADVAEGIADVRCFNCNRKQEYR